jgi:integrase
MGCVYQRRYTYCLDCKRQKSKACDEHRRETRTLPTWWIKYSIDGRPKHESAETDKKKVAEAKLRDRETAKDRGIQIDPKLGRIRFDEAVELLRVDYLNNDKSSLADTETRIKLHLEPVFGRDRMTSITADRIDAYTAARRAEGAANGTINRELTAVKRMFNLAREKKKLSYDHIPSIKMLEENNVRIGFFERDQYLAVLGHMPEPLRPVVTFAYLTGWRVADEVLALEWRQVDRQAAEVRLDAGATKNGDGRLIHFSPELRTLFEAQWQAHEEMLRQGIICPYVFGRIVVTPKLGKVGRPFSASGCGKAWERARTAAGCPGRILHDFRRTAVRNMVRNGIPERVAMRISGHKTRSVFERYNIVSDRDLREAALRLDGYTDGYNRPEVASASGSNSQKS